MSNDTHTHQAAKPIKSAVIGFAVGTVVAQAYGYFALERSYENIRSLRPEELHREMSHFYMAWGFILLSPVAGIIAAAVAAIGEKIVRR